MTATTAPLPTCPSHAPRSTLRMQMAVILVLCMLDGLLTLRVLQMGAIEWNPIMNALLDFGPATFLGVKLVWTMIGCAVLLLLGRHRAAQRGMAALLVAYICLTGYHLVGQAQYAILALS